MNIVYVGKFANEWNTENYVAYGLRNIGHMVAIVPHNRPYSDFRYAMDRMNPAFVMFSKPSPGYAGVRWGTEAIKFCHKIGVPVVTWQWDLWWGWRPHIPDHFKESDILLTSDGGHDELWESCGYNHRTLRQGIHGPECAVYGQREAFDVGFVGGKEKHYWGRVKLLNWLSSEYGARFEWIQHIRGLSLNKMLAKIKIVVGDSHPSPNYWSNRIYEMLGRGAFFLHPKTEGLDAEFVDGVHYISYDRDDYRDLKEKIEYYLPLAEKRDEIRRAGNARMKTLRYEDRCVELLRILKSELGIGEERT